MQKNQKNKTQNTQQTDKAKLVLVKKLMQKTHKIPLKPTGICKNCTCRCVCVHIYKIPQHTIQADMV